ncbi:MAG: patatin-like phospholipase family protein [Spirochaetales bacterium]|nr:patatin-like phospholipase family protein [Spirochaetales bacterium]
MNSSFFGFYAHAGFLLGLTDSGLKFTHVSGASAGALVGGLYTAGLSPRRLIQLFLQPDLLHVFKEFKAPLRFFKMLTGSRGHTGIFAGTILQNLIENEVGVRRIEDASPTFSLSVLDLKHQESRVVQSGPLADYIVASCAVPGLFAAVEIGNGHFWDGGVADPLPFEHLLDDSRIHTIVLHLVQSSSDEPTYSFYGALVRSHSIISSEIIRLKTELARHKKKKLIILETRTAPPRPGNRQAGIRAINAGLATARDNSATWKRLRQDS